MDKGKVDNAIINLIGAFATYAVKDGDHSSLTKAELKELLQKEMRNTIGKADEARMDQIFRDLDDDKNGVVDFTDRFLPGFIR